MNTIDLKNRTAIVTGGARGIGFAIARRFLASGATVALWDMDAAALETAVASLNGGNRVCTATLDVTDRSALPLRGGSWPRAQRWRCGTWMRRRSKQPSRR